jgi:hypothetical protein
MTNHTMKGRERSRRDRKNDCSGVGVNGRMACAVTGDRTEQMNRESDESFEHLHLYIYHGDPALVAIGKDEKRTIQKSKCAERCYRFFQQI